MSPAPTFVVVGHVNKGKSSLVATLLEDPSIPIDLVPGTTTKAQQYDFRLDGEVVFRLVDTPGFQEAAAALDWLNQRADSAAERRPALQEFIHEFSGQGRFQDEVALLQPMLAEGPVALLYVVDASRPYRDSHEAEMEILRWTGLPGLALMNRIGDGDHSSDWQVILQQFFSAVRSFNTHAASAQDRLQLVRTFAALDAEWTSSLERAAAQMDSHWRQREQDALAIVGQFAAEAWSHVERMAVPAQETGAKDLEKLRQRYEKHLRKLEEGARRQVEQLFGFAALERDDSPVDLTPEDLFDTHAWKLLGLNKKQLTARAAAAGGATGGVIDLFTGGLSLGAGVALGATLGAAGAWFGSNQVAKAWSPKHTRLAELLPGEHGFVQAFGPIRNEGFAWILLDRALIHFAAIRGRAHAKQGPLHLADVHDQRAHALSQATRDRADAILAHCQREGQQGAKPETIAQYGKDLADLLQHELLA